MQTLKDKFGILQLKPCLSNLDKHYDKTLFYEVLFQTSAPMPSLWRWWGGGGVQPQKPKILCVQIIILNVLFHQKQF